MVSTNMTATAAVLAGCGRGLAWRALSARRQPGAPGKMSFVELGSGRNAARGVRLTVGGVCKGVGASSFSRVCEPTHATCPSVHLRPTGVFFQISSTQGLCQFTLDEAGMPEHRISKFVRGVHGRYRRFPVVRFDWLIARLLYH